MKASHVMAAFLYTIVITYLVMSGLYAHDGFTWFLEVVWVIVGVALLLHMHLKGRVVTWLLGLGLFVHAMILIYGGWYTYEQVPLGFWLQDVFGFDRNHYDRIGHVAQGFVPALLYREVVVRWRVVKNRKWCEVIVFAMVMAFTALFELLEFGAALAFGQGADAFLGSQGDVWDAQWDMLMCGLGGLASMAAFGAWHHACLQKHFDCPMPEN